VKKRQNYVYQSDQKEYGKWRATMDFSAKVFHM